MIEQRAVAVRRVLQLLEEVPELRDVVGLDLDVLLHLLGPVLVVGDGMMAVGDANLRIRPVADLARDHERHDARDIGLVGQRHQVVHQLDVLLVVERHTRRTRRQLQILVALALLGALNPPLNLAHVLEILRHHLAVGRAELQLQAGDVPGDRVEDAACLP